MLSWQGSTAMRRTLPVGFSILLLLTFCFPQDGPRTGSTRGEVVTRNQNGEPAVLPDARIVLRGSTNRRGTVGRVGSIRYRWPSPRNVRPRSECSRFEFNACGGSEAEQYIDGYDRTRYRSWHSPAVKSWLVSAHSHEKWRSIALVAFRKKYPSGNCMAGLP